MKLLIIALATLGIITIAYPNEVFGTVMDLGINIGEQLRNEEK